MTARIVANHVVDRVTLQPRLPIPGLGVLLAWVVDVFFKRRHRRLQSYRNPLKSTRLRGFATSEWIWPNHREAPDAAAVGRAVPT